MSRVSAHWVPRLLTPKEKMKRVEASHGFLMHAQRDKKFLGRVITIDVTWLHYFEPEGKRESSVWKNPGTPPPKKVKVVKSMGKIMYIMFVDRHETLLTRAVPTGQTVNSAYNSKVIRRDLMNAIRKKRPELYADVENIIFHQDNAPSHTARETQFEIDLIGFRKIVHPPYSTDLAPLDFAFFPLLKSHLRRKRCADATELNQATINFIRKLLNTWFQGVSDKWINRQEKCVRHNGEYFEKE